MAQIQYGITRPVSHGRGYSEPFAVAEPAAGAGFTYTVDGRYMERLVSVCFQLVTSSTASNRFAVLQLQDAQGNVQAAIPAAAAQTASLTRTYTFMVGQSSVIGPDSSYYLSPLFEHVIRPDWKVVLVITGVEAGDQVSGVQVNRDRFETGDYGYPTGALDVTDPAHLAAIELANLTA